jgi:hypothetical protein
MAAVACLIAVLAGLCFGSPNTWVSNYVVMFFELAVPSKVLFAAVLWFKVEHFNPRVSNQATSNYLDSIQAFYGSWRALSLA